MKAWFSRDKTKYNTYGKTGNQLSGWQLFPSKSMYQDFEKMPFQPIDNLGQYWYEQFLSQPTVQTLGFVLHTTDLLQPHHTWTTSDKNHAGWESWVNDYYYKENLADLASVDAAMSYFDPIPASSRDLRPLLTQGGAFSYSNGGIVLSSTGHYDRLQVAQQVIPHGLPWLFMC